MNEAIIAITAMLAAGLVFFSGFGLNTILMPVMALMLGDVEVAVAAAAVVHFVNGLFKAALMFRDADRRVAVRFGLTGVIGALIGAAALSALGNLGVVTTYTLAGRTHDVTAMKLIVGLMIVAFAALELSPLAERWRFDVMWMPLGGALSGFFGGLSGHQGALRTCFLVRAGLSKERLIGTGALCAAMIDSSRIIVYVVGAAVLARSAGEGPGMWSRLTGEGGARWLVLAGIGGAIIGSLIGRSLLRSTTINGVRVVVGVALLLAGSAMAAGLI